MSPADLAHACISRPVSPERQRKAARHISSWAFWDATLALIPAALRQGWLTGMASVLAGKLGPRGAH